MLGGSIVIIDKILKDKINYGKLVDFKVEMR